MKKAQMKISFGMIVSIILIILFIAVAFYVIKAFLGIQKETKIANFADDFQDDVDSLWKSSEGSRQKTYTLPGSVDYVCFADLEESKKGRYSEIYEEIEKYANPQDNLFLHPVRKIEMNSFEMDNINLETITQDNNPFCVRVDSEKIDIILEKNFEENLVRIKKE